MQLAQLPASPIAGLRAVELTAADEPALQRFFEANPDYFRAVLGEAAGPNEAHDAIHGALPPGRSFTKKYLLGYVDAAGSVVAMANVVSDLLAAGVWHIGLFLVATARHGTGEAQELYRSLETWAVMHGARWFRLGVVEGNARAARFWERLGYEETRTRSGFTLGKLTHTVRVMVKPLAGGTVEEYLALVERDRPDTRDSS